MGSYESDLAKIVEGRRELAKAEKLLNLPVTMYPEVVRMQKDMQDLRQIYGIYKAQKVGYQLIFLMSNTFKYAHSSCQ